jgi:hypothetical protein
MDNILSIEFIFVTALFVVSTILLYVSNKKYFNKVGFWKTSGLFLLFYIIRIILYYYPDLNDIWLSSITWPIVGGYILLKFIGNSHFIDFLNDYCDSMQEIIDAPEEEEIEKTKANHVLKEIKQIIRVLSASL